MQEQAVLKCKTRETGHIQTTFIPGENKSPSATFTKNQALQRNAIMQKCSFEHCNNNALTPLHTAAPV